MSDKIPPKIPGGYTIWARQTFDSKMFYKKPDKWFKIWFYIINKVNFEDDDKYKRGSGFMTYEQIQSATRATRAQVKHCLEFLRKNSMCATRKATRGMHVTVCKYTFYQNHKNYKSPTESPTKAPQKPHRSPTKGKKGRREEGLGAFRKGRESLDSSISKVTSKDLSVKKSWKDFPTLTGDHQKFVDTFLKWVQTEHRTNWQGWKTDAGSQGAVYNQQFNSALDALDKLQRIDGFSFEDVLKAARWGMEDKFWKQNFMRLGYLRERKVIGKINGVVQREAKYITRFLANRGKSGKGKIEAWLKRMEAKDEQQGI